MSCTQHIVKKDMLNQDALQELQTIKQLSLEQTRTLELSLRHVSEIDASGVASLLRLQSNLSRQNKQLVLCDISPSLHEQLRSVGADRVFTLMPQLNKQPQTARHHTPALLARLIAMMF